MASVSYANRSKLARARKKAVALESPDNQIFKSIEEAKTAFLTHCNSEGLKYSTVRKYRNTLNHLLSFCEKKSIDWIAELTTDHLDAFRAGRKLKPITSSKELELLRQFCGFCIDRKWWGGERGASHQITAQEHA
jgi:site-specific recombinase XerD